MNYPYTIDNGHGEQLSFLNRVTKDNIEYLEVSNYLLPGSGPPLHVHYQQEECITVVEGTMGIQVADEEPRYLGPGDTAQFNRGILHRFWNAGETPLKCTGQIWPIHNIEYFLTEVYRLTSADSKGRPAAFDMAYLLHRYRSEFGMRGIPVFVRKIIFPAALFVGKLQGRHKRYANAPLPLK